MRNLYSTLVLIIREIGFVVIGLLKIPVAIIRFILGLLIFPIAIISEFGRGWNEDDDSNYFGKILSKLWPFVEQDYK